MIEPVVLERLGDTVDAVVVVEWLVAVGARVTAGDAIVRVETDKVEVDVAAPVSGTVVAILAVEDDEIVTGAVICHIDTA